MRSKAVLSREHYLIRCSASHVLKICLATGLIAYVVNFFLLYPKLFPHKKEEKRKDSDNTDPDTGSTKVSN